jgi:hypothetical protein
MLARRGDGADELKLEEITATSGQIVKLAECPTDSVASGAVDKCGGGRTCGIGDLNRESAAIPANDLEARSLTCRSFFCARHSRAHQHAIKDVR